MGIFPFRYTAYRKHPYRPWGAQAGSLPSRPTFHRLYKKNRLDTYLRNKDWTGFAKRYNGPAYAENQYDKKLEKAYHKYKK